MSLIKNLFNKNKNQQADVKTNIQSNANTKYGWKKIFSFKELNDDFYDELEEKLIEADVGSKNTLNILDRFKNKIKSDKITEKETALNTMKEILLSLIQKEKTEINLNNNLNVLLIIGVNGVGKTTTIAKIANHFLQQNKKIVLGAADTFRAAAKEQLQLWGNSLQIPVISQKEGADPASVAFDTVQSALARNADIAIIDTAGRLHNKENLLAQLDKINRVIDRFEGISRKNLLILDATLGQNGFEQTKIFKDRIGLDYAVLTKVDTNAKGGVLLAISDHLSIPVLFICHGEKINDISYFQPEEYVNSLL